MKDYFNDVISFDSLYFGLRKSCNGVRWKDSTVNYEANGLKNTLALCEKLENETYEIGDYQVFKIYEPKERIIMAARLVDRQFQRSLCDNGLYEDITEHFIRDNIAYQMGRGTSDALDRLTYLLRRYYRKNGNKGWVLKCDIHHFFQEINHDVAKEAIRKVVSDKKAAQAVEEIIDSFDGDTGLGLGSQVSQLVALAVLNELDHFIKEKLRIKVYIRYSDDFVLVHPNKEYLQFCYKEIENRLARIHLKLNKKTCIHPLEQGIKFLKWRFIITDTGKVLRLMDKKKTSKRRRRLRKLWLKEVCGQVAPGTTAESLRSYLSDAAHGSTYRQSRALINYYENMIGEQYEY